MDNRATAQLLAKYGYRAIMVYYYGPETSYYEFIQPPAAPVKQREPSPESKRLFSPDIFLEERGQQC